jgi:hypothetical protein
MPQVGFEPIILLFEGAKKVHDLDCEASMVGSFSQYYSFKIFELCNIEVTAVEEVRKPLLSG